MDVDPQLLPRAGPVFSHGLAPFAPIITDISPFAQGEILSKAERPSGKDGPGGPQPKKCKGRLT